MNNEFQEFQGLSSSTRSYPFWGASADTSSRQTIVFRAESPIWVNVIAKRLESFGDLKRDWDSHDGLPLNQKARARTVETIRRMGGDDLPVPNVVLNSGGSVGLEWEEDGRELELGIGDDGVNYLTFDSSGVPRTGQVSGSFHELRQLAKWLLSGPAVLQPQLSTSTHYGSPR